jgi:hypothetical protein
MSKKRFWNWKKVWFGFMVFNATFNNISVISRRSVLLVEETGGPVFFFQKKIHSSQKAKLIVNPRQVRSLWPNPSGHESMIGCSRTQIHWLVIMHTRQFVWHTCKILHMHLFHAFTDFTIFFISEIFHNCLLLV